MFVNNANSLPNFPIKTVHTHAALPFVETLIQPPNKSPSSSSPLPPAYIKQPASLIFPSKLRSAGQNKKIMYLTHKQSPLSFFSKSNPNPSYPVSIPKPFDQTLICRLSVLLGSLTDSSSSSPVPLSFLAAAVDLLSSTLSSFASLLSDPALSRSAADVAALSSYLDASTALLDAANSLTSSIDRLSRLRLHLAYAVHLLAHKPPTDDLTCKARAFVAEWQQNLRRNSAATISTAARIRREKRSPPAKMSAVQRAIVAVEAVSALVIGIVASFIGERADLDKIRVSSEFCWSEAFNSVLKAVNGRIGGFAAEIEVVDAGVKDLMAAIDDGKELSSMAEAMEKKTARLTEGLDRLWTAVNAMFREAIRSRDVALQGFRIESRNCK